MNVAVLNLGAVVFFVLSFAVAGGLRAFLFPRVSDALLAAVALGLCAACDLVWRWTRGKKGRWFGPSQGGSLLLVPVWAVALLWLAKVGYEAAVGPLPHLSLASIGR